MKKKNKNRNDDKVHVSRRKNVRKFDNHDFFICIDAEKRNNINRKKHEAKSRQIVNETLFQQIHHAQL